jgi:Rad3-related DNA helicase
MRTSTGHLYLIDFGIARLFKPGQIQDTNPFISMGYSAPEQYGAAQTTPRSDIYSLGATLYHLISGKRPRPLQGLYRFEPLQKFNKPIFSEFETLIMEMVEFEERKRPENMIIVKKKLEDIKKQLTAQSMKSTQNTSIDENQLPPIQEKLILRPEGDSLNSAITEKFTTSIRNDVTSITNKASRKKKPLSNEFSHLQQIVSTDLSHGGILSERLQGYEERRAQIEMATLVARALTEERHAIVEAATGTGKSLAYLLPIVRSGKVAIISTANKALQEQLFYKDIPFVQEHIQEFEAALVKGMGNYICLDRLEKERIETQPFLKNPDFTRLMNIVKEFELNITGDFETLGFTLPNDIRNRVNADSDQCAWRECPFFSRCYVRQMRDAAALSQVIVVNHTLLLLDAVLDGYLLPKHDVIVVDEAHHLEEEATQAFTVTVSESKISALLAQQRLKQHSRADLQEEAKQTMKFAWDRLDQITRSVSHKGRVILQEPLQEGLHLATIIAKLAESLREQRPEYMEEPENSLYDKLLTRTDNLSEAIRKVFSVDQRDTYVYYIERDTKPGRRGTNLEVNATPLDVNSLLREHLFNESKVICTSATLATVGANPVDLEDQRPNFAYFRSRVGLDHTNYPDVLEHILPYSFDYETNALLYLPRHLPEPVFGPDTHYYTNKIAEEMMHLVEASQGRAFLLFSSKRMLDAVYNIFLDSLPTYLDYRLLRQGEMNRIELVHEFRASGSAILFGLKSFWEGVDIAGESLSLVVIDKMPFDPPDDPVHEARVARMKANKENWFGNYVLPQAVLRLKQGLGRLLRTHDDRGVMAILDTRLHTKSYGKLVINALPPARRTGQLKNVEHFFEAFDDTPF